MYYIIIFVVCFVIGVMSSMMDNVNMFSYTGFEWLAIWVALAFNVMCWRHAPIRTGLWYVCVVAFVILTYGLNQELKPNFIMIMYTGALPIITTMYFWKFFIAGVVVHKVVNKYSN